MTTETSLEFRANEEFSQLLDRKISEKGYESRKHFLQHAEERELVVNVGTANGWFGEKYLFPIFFLYKIVADIGISSDDLSQVYGRNPFEPDIEDLKNNNNGVGRLIEFYINLRTGKSKRRYLQEAKEKGLINNSGTAGGWILGQRNFPLLYLDKIVTNLNIPLEELSQVYGKNPFIPDIEVFKKSDNPIGRLIDFYIDLRTGDSRDKYLQIAKDKELIEKVGTATSWISGFNPISLFYLNNIATDLEIPLEMLIQLFGRNPFEPDIEKFKNSDNPVGRLIDFYIDLRTGKPREQYLQQVVEKGLIKSYGTAIHWFSKQNTIQSFYLKKFAINLKIPLEELAQVNGRNPFEPDIGEFKDSGNGVGKLIDFYIDLRIGTSRDKYLKQAKEKGLIEHVGTATNWIKNSDGRNTFPLLYLDKIVADLEISLDNLTQVYGRNPFEPDIEHFKNSSHSISKLINFYVDLRTGKSTRQYLQHAEERDLVKNAGSAINWIYGTYPFPPHKLKILVDDLNIPYDKINQFLDYDISTVKEPVVVNDAYIDSVTRGTINDASVQYLFMAARDNGLDENMRNCIADIIVSSNDQLLYKKSLVNQKLTEYLGSNGNGHNPNPDSIGLINAIEDLFRGYAFLEDVPDNINETLTELTRRVYHSQYGDLGVSISQQLESDIGKVKIDSTKKILRDVKSFFDFQEGILRDVYAEDLKPTVATSNVTTL